MARFRPLTRRSARRQTELGDVLACGRGREGQLGRGSRADAAVPTVIAALVRGFSRQSLRFEFDAIAIAMAIAMANQEPAKRTLLTNWQASELVVAIAAGSMHALALTASGRVFQWGALHTIVDDKTQKAVPTFGNAIRMPGLQTRKIIERSSMAYYAGERLESKDMEQLSRELNFGHFKPKIEEVPVPLAFFDDKPVAKLAAGYSFSMCATQDGALYAWGFNDVGQLGLGHRFNSHNPLQVDALATEHIVDVACGQQHVVAVTKTGNVYSWGLGVFGQLGHGALHNERKPRLIAGIERAKSVRCGAHFTVVLLDDGTPLVFGHAEYGQHGSSQNHVDYFAGEEEEAGFGLQLGRRRGGGNSHAHASPRTPAVFKGKVIEDMACGSLHSVALVRERSKLDGLSEVLTYGYGGHGALGHGDRRFALVPQAVFGLTNVPVAQVAAGAKHTLCIGKTTSFALDYVNAYRDRASSDTVFVVRDSRGRERHLFAHSALLAERMPGLERLLCFQQRFTNAHTTPSDEFVNETTGAPKRQISLGRTPFQVVRAMLIYAYTDQIQV